MHRWKSRLWERICAGFDAFAAWSDSPQGRLVRWTIGVLVTLILFKMGAGHPVG